MAKQVQATVQNEQPKLAIKATVTLKSYAMRDKTTREYIAADLINPFDGEDFDVELTPKWKSDKGIFDYKARKHLKDNSSLEVEGYLAPVKYYSKRLKRDVFVVGCFIKNPFFAGDIELRIANEEQYSVLAFFCSEAWHMKLSRYYDEDAPASDAAEE